MSKKIVQLLLFAMATMMYSMAEAAPPAPWEMGDAHHSDSQRTPSSDEELELEDLQSAPVILEEEVHRIQAKKSKLKGKGPASETASDKEDYEIIEP